MTLNQLTEKIEQNNVLDFGTILNRSIELFKKVWLQGLVTILLTFVLVIPFYLIVYVPLFALGFSNPSVFENEQTPPVMAIIMIVVMPLLMVGMLAISIALNSAFLRICKFKDLGGSEADDYFFYLKNGRWKKSLVLGLLIFAVALAGMLLCGIGLIYAIVPLSLIPAFFAFNEEIPVMDMLKASFKLGNKNWLIIFGLMMITGIMAELGIILCGVGIFFTAMFAKIPTYFIYKDGVGFAKELNE